MKSRMITYEDRMHIARRINTLRLDELSQIEFGKRRCRETCNTLGK